jgi:hypothetical protein
LQVVIDWPGVRDSPDPSAPQLSALACEATGPSPTVASSLQATIETRSKIPVDDSPPVRKRLLTIIPKALLVFELMLPPCGPA